MHDLDFIKLFVSPLNEIQVEYLISGSVAAMFYGEPRVTHDIDLIVHLKPVDTHRLLQVYPETEYYLPPEEVIQIEMARDYRGHFNVIHHESGLKADFYSITNLPGNPAEA